MSLELWLKRLLRRLLPAGAHHALRRAAHGWRLRRAATVAVDASALPTAAALSEAMGAGAGPAEEWAAAQRIIQETCAGVWGAHAIDEESRRALYILVRRARPRNALELGTNGGASTAHMAMALKAGGAAAGAARLVTVDLWDVNREGSVEARHYGVSVAPAALLARLGCAELVEFVVAHSTEYLSGREAAYDFILLDHAPAADIAYRDIAAALRALRPGGQLWLHPLPVAGQALYPGFALALRRLQREGAVLVSLPWPAPGGSTLVGLART